MKKRSATTLYNCLVSSLNQNTQDGMESRHNQTTATKNNWVFHLKPDKDIQSLAAQALKPREQKTLLNKIIRRSEECNDNDWIIIPMEQNNQYHVIPICLTKRQHAVTLIVQSNQHSTIARILDPVGKMRGMLANGFYRSDLDLHVQAHLVSMGFEKNIPWKVVYMDHQKIANDSQCTYWCQHYIEWIEDKLSDKDVRSIDDAIDGLKKQASQLPDESHFAQKVSADTFAEVEGQILDIDTELDYAILETDTKEKADDQKPAPKAGIQ